MSKVIRMRGLPFRATQDDIRAFFHAELTNPMPQFRIVDISIEIGADGRPNGEALVEFASEVESESAMLFDRQMMGHRYVELRRAWRNAIDAHCIPNVALRPIIPVVPVVPITPKESDSSSSSRRDRDKDRDRDRDRRSRSRSRSRTRKDRDRRSRSRDRDRRDRDRDRRSRSKSKSPPPKKREKKKSNWDAPPDPVASAGEPIGNNPQLTYKARRIFVGNLPQDPPVTDVMLREFFDQAMQQAGLSAGSGSCVSDVWISSEKNFAFIEVRTVQEANNAMTLDGITLYGSALRVNRPHDYIPPAVSDAMAGFSAAAAGRPAAAMGMPGLAGLPMAGVAGVAGMAGMAGMPGVGVPVMPTLPMPSMAQMGLPGLAGMPNMTMNMMTPAANFATLMQLTKKSRRVHIGNLPIGVGLTPAMLKQFIAQLMQQLRLTVKPGDPITDSFVSSDGKFGFVEMRTIAEANNSLNLSGIDFMGRPIRVGRPADYVVPTPEIIMQCEGTGILGTPGDLGVTEVPGMPPGPDMNAATKVVVLKNMMSDAELSSDTECAEISEDTIAKCEEDFGKVVCMIIARPGRDGLQADIAGKVFLQFEQIEDAKKAANGLHLVKFDERVVETAFHDEAIMDELKKLYPEQVRS